MDLPHPLTVTLCEIFVDRDDVNALAFQGIEVDSHDGCQGLSFTCLHFSDIASVKHICTFQLAEERELTDHTLRRFSGDRKSFRLNVIERLTILKSFPEFDGLVLKLFIAQRSHLIFELIDCRNSLFNFIQDLFIAIE